MTTGMTGELGSGSPFAEDPMALNAGMAGDHVTDAGGTRNEEVVSQLNSFLRGEISATETYRMAMDKVRGGDAPTERNVGLLRDIQADHGRAAQSIRERIRELGGSAADSSGVWGAWAKFTEGVANLFGDAASLKALKEGEEHGLKDYMDGLSHLDTPSSDLLQNQLIPLQRRHIDLLDQLIAGIHA